MIFLLGRIVMYVINPLYFRSVDGTHLSMCECVLDNEDRSRVTLLLPHTCCARRHIFGYALLLPGAHSVWRFGVDSWGRRTGWGSIPNRFLRFR